ncbi:MAG: hypothetical protein HY332_10935 [Chloroflexi bacterium]|nr:hypothetical protein [Chloroflexota bacterium]
MARIELELAGRPDKVEHLLTVVTQVERERLWPVIENSPARMILHGVHFSSQMAPPPLFRRSSSSGPSGQPVRLAYTPIASGQAGPLPPDTMGSTA